MKRIPRTISRSIAGFFPEQYILTRHFPCFLPFYHVVSNEKLPYILNYPYRSVVQFEKELDFYLRYFHPVSLEELVSEKNTGRKIFHLSFDDGLRQCADVVAPILLRKGIPATFFINTAFADNRQLFHKYKASLILSRLREKTHPEAEKLLKQSGLEGNGILKASIEHEPVLNKAAQMLDIGFDEFLKREKPYLSSTQILKMAAEGFTFGAHSHTHPEFWNLKEEEQLNEVKISMNWVNQLLTPQIKAFSFPFTDSGVPAKVLTVIERETLCDITFGTAGIKHDSFKFHLQRYPVEQAGDFLGNLKAEIVYYKLRKWIGKATVIH
jgi:peptidoglycan/xylan/chitin deacetylase (PgdA/CDA1 family)